MKENEHSALLLVYTDTQLYILKTKRRMQSIPTQIRRYKP